MENTIFCENCLDTMAKMPNDFIDLTITSPPYDNLRDYKGYTFDFENIAKELFRITKQGGVVVWIVGDSVIDGSESGNSFRQALFFKEIGFNLHDTMIYEKAGVAFPDNVRYYQTFEYMFVFSKGIPKSFNPISDRKNIWAGSKVHSTQRNKDGTVTPKSGNGKVSEETGIRFNVWRIPHIDTTARQLHPATFPESLAQDHIISWSSENDLIYDPFMGSGTTAKMAKLLKRNYIGSEISAEYCEIAQKRLDCMTRNLF